MLRSVALYHSKSLIGVLIYPAFVGSPSGGHAALHDSLVATSKHVADNLVVGSTVVWDLCRRADEIVAGVTQLVEILQTHHAAAISHDELQMRDVTFEPKFEGRRHLRNENKY